MKKFAPLIAVLSLLCSSATLAQERLIRGKVTDETGIAVADVSVALKGKPAQTKTDLTGSFTISAPPGSTELIFTHISFPETSIRVTGDAVSVTLQNKSSRQLDEVVVVGYGTQKRRDITGAVATFNTDKIDERPIARVDQALVGQMAGVRVKQTSGLPGRGFSIQIRGTGSISAGTEPLYVIDGFPLEQSPQNVSGGFTRVIRLITSTRMILNQSRF